MQSSSRPAPLVPHISSLAFALLFGFAGNAEFASSLRHVRPGNDFHFAGDLFAASPVCGGKEVECLRVVVGRGDPLSIRDLQP